MHELSIAQTILNAALAELKHHAPARLTKVRIVVGQQHAIVPDNLKFAYEALSRQTPAEGSALDIQIRPVAARCRHCGWTGTLRGALYACGACGTCELSLTGGTELYLESLEVDTYEHAHP